MTDHRKHPNPTDPDFDDSYGALLDEAKSTTDTSRIREIYAEWNQDPGVIHFLGYNPATPDDLLITMIQDGHGRAILGRPDTPEKALQVMGVNTDAVQRAWAAERTEDPDLLTQLCYDPVSNVRLSVLWNPTVRPSMILKVLDQVTSESDLHVVLEQTEGKRSFDVSSQILRHPLVTEEMRTRIAIETRGIYQHA